MSTIDLKIGGLIKKSTEYDAFKLRKDNRPIDLLHVKRLKKSIQKHNDLHLKPMIINEENEVIDGQNRLQAAKELGVPIYYIVDKDYSPEKMINLNITQKNWKQDDFLNYWIEHGREDYKKIDGLMKDLNFPLHLVLKWMVGTSGNTYKDFKLGNFKFTLTETTLKAIMHVKRLIEIMKNQNFKPIIIYNQGAFHDALKTFFTNPIVEAERFFDKFNKVPFTFRYCQGSHDYLDQLVEIYNYDMKKDRVQLISDGKSRRIQKS